MNYDALAIFARTWGLFYLIILFVAVLFYALRPGAKKQFDDAAQIPLRED